MLSDLRPGLNFHHYQLLEQIGVGGQGVVWSAVDRKRNVIAAIKFNEVAGSDQQQADDIMFEQQLEKLLSVQHTHILPVYDYGLENNVRYLVSPFVAGGSIFERIRRGLMPLEESLRYIAEVASALDYLHKKGIIHRDLKPSNVLLNLKRHSFLADFGLARAVSLTTQAMHTGRGTPPYAPPEQHKRGEITPRSDIYSFGIMLFEIFTGQLPWNGERMLGIQQLYSNVELPDPSELNNTLPPLMADALRRITSAEPARRPSSMAEVLKMIYYIFNIKEAPPWGREEEGENIIRARDADELFNQSLALWKADEANANIGLTKFAMIHVDQKTRNEGSMPAGFSRFMLFNALMYGYNDEYWWSRVSDPAEKIRVTSALLGRKNETVAARLLDRLAADQSINVKAGDPLRSIVTPVLEMAARSKNPTLAGRLIDGLRAVIPSAKTWNNSVLSPEQDKLLAGLAIEDSETGDKAARLIGRLHSQPAVQIVLNRAAGDRMIPALLDIQKSAGSLPSFVRSDLRLRVFFEWVVQRLTMQPIRLIGTYLLALFGTTLGIGTQVYLTYRLPEFMDVARISASLEQGLITGAIFSLGILFTRMIVERLAGLSGFVRTVVATLVGAIAMNLALFTFHVLFINTPPGGFLITLGCLLIAGSFAVGGLFQARWVSILLTTPVVFGTITGTWWIHASLAGSITDLTPLFYYDYSWSIIQIGLTALALSAWIGIFANLTSLATAEE